MAEAPEFGNNPASVILVVVALLAFFVPSVGDFVFKWMPAATSVVTGVPVPGDIRNIPQSPREQNVVVALEPVNQGLLAQAGAAFDIENQAPLTGVTADISSWWTRFVPFAIFISLLFIVGIIYSVVRLLRIREMERAILNVVEHPLAGNDTTRAQLRWQKIVEHANTENPNDWRQAIIEADIMLDELLSVQGYHGDTVGDKMKQVERSDFNTIDLAWEAHKVRNRIAHEGLEHDLNARETRRVIGLYEQVLREFHYI